MGYQWPRRTIRETYARIASDPKFAWVAIGNFLDDWRGSARSDRPELVTESIQPAGCDRALQRWAAFCAAMVEWLCWQDGLPLPDWTRRAEYCLEEPWFLYPGERLRAWQLVTTPAPFKMRNVFGGEHILDRV